MLRSLFLRFAFPFLLSLAAASAARAQEAPGPAPVGPTARLEGRVLHLDLPGGSRTVELPCEGRAVLVTSDRAFVACGRDGVVVIRPSPGGPAVGGVVGVSGEAVGFFVAGGRVWVETTQTLAQPLDALGPGGGPSTALDVPPPRATGPSAPVPAPPPGSSTPAATPSLPPPLPAPPAPPPAHRLGQVLELDEQVVVVDLGSRDGLRTGSSVALHPPPGSVVADERFGAAPLAVGEVVALGEDHARVRLGFGESVPEGGRAELVDARPTRSRVAPPRMPGMSFAVGLRPMLSLAVEGVVVAADASFEIRGERSWFVRAELEPFVGAIGAAEESGAFAARVDGGFDHRIFALGVGLGVAHVELDFGGGVRPMIDQVVRIGALDGLHVAATNGFARLGGGSGFQWAFVEAALQLPAGAKSWILLRGGGGTTRYEWGDVALRHMLRGNGGRGSLFLSVHAGGAGLRLPEDFDDPFADSTSPYAGPYVGAGLEWRR